MCTFSCYRERVHHESIVIAGQYCWLPVYFDSPVYKMIHLSDQDEIFCENSWLLSDFDFPSLKEHIQ